MLLASLDLLGLNAELARRISAAIASKTGIPDRNVILCCTHTHSGPLLSTYLDESTVNPAYLPRLQKALVKASTEAVASARPARIGWAEGMAHIGFNRRLCWADGTHTMFGESSRPDFTGIEGPDDPRHVVLHAVDDKGQILAIVHNNSCHPICGTGFSFASADFPGEARDLIRKALDRKLPVLYLQGASGDTSPWNMTRKPSYYNAEQRLREMGATLAAETLRLLNESGEPVANPVLRHAFEDLSVDIRLPTPEALKRARAIVKAGEKKAGRWDYVLSRDGVLRLHQEFKDNPRETLAVHALRIGRCAIITNPAELFCQFGIDMRRRSPAATTMVAQLADGGGSYCPTIPGVLGGGYSGEAIYWCRYEPYAGYKLVETSARLLNHVFAEGNRIR